MIFFFFTSYIWTAIFGLGIIKDSSIAPGIASLINLAKRTPDFNASKRSIFPSVRLG